MNIIDKYDRLANKIIAEDPEIQEYEESLKNKKAHITSLLPGNNPLVLLNPLKLVRLLVEKRRLVRISGTLGDLKKTTILNNMDEESGEIKTDLYNSAYSFKPRRIKLYMKQNPVYNEEIDRKISLYRK